MRYAQLTREQRYQIKALLDIGCRGTRIAKQLGVHKSTISRDVTLREDYTRLTKGRAGQAMACLNNLILGILLSKKMFRTIPTARRYFSAHPDEALNLFLRL